MDESIAAACGIAVSFGPATPDYQVQSCAEFKITPDQQTSTSHTGNVGANASFYDGNCDCYVSAGFFVTS